MRLAIIPLAAVALLACRVPAYADATTEAQLRAALQASTAQIAQLEDQVANLQAAQAPDVAMIEALKAQVQTLGKNGASAAAPAANAADQAKTDKQLAALQRELAARNAELGKAQTGYAAASGDASAKAAQNTALQGKLTDSGTQLSSCDAKNSALYNLGNQILDAYAHKDDLLSGFANHEPFIGFKRVQLQNIVQNDQDTLFENQVNPGAAAH